MSTPTHADTGEDAVRAADRLPFPPDPTSYAHSRGVYRSGPVALAASGVLDPHLVARIADAIRSVLDRPVDPDTADWNDYFDFEKEVAGLIEAFPRINASPLGAGAMTTSRFPLDRPFRAGHDFAKAISVRGRQARVAPRNLDHGLIGDLYRSRHGAELPLTDEGIDAAVDADHFVQSRAGRGGPQASETKRMLAEHFAHLQSAIRFAEAKRESIRDAAADLDRRFLALLDEAEG